MQLPNADIPDPPRGERIEIHRRGAAFDRPGEGGGGEGGEGEVGRLDECV